MRSSNLIFKIKSNYIFNLTGKILQIINFYYYCNLNIIIYLDVDLYL